jgi:hypothetical protein
MPSYITNGLVSMDDLWRDLIIQAAAAIIIIIIR